MAAILGLQIENFKFESLFQMRLRGRRENRHRQNRRPDLFCRQHAKTDAKTESLFQMRLRGRRQNRRRQNRRPDFSHAKIAKTDTLSFRM